MVRRSVFALMLTLILTAVWAGQALAFECPRHIGQARGMLAAANAKVASLQNADSRITAGNMVALAEILINEANEGHLAAVRTRNGNLHAEATAKAKFAVALLEQVTKHPWQ